MRFSKVPRALLEDKVFIFTSSVFLMLALASSRLLLSHYLLYRDESTANIVKLLKEENLPFRDEKRNAILASVQSIFFGEHAMLNCDNTKTDAEVSLCAELQGKRRAFDELVAGMACRDEPCARKVASRAVRTWPNGQPEERNKAENEIAGLIKKYYVANIHELIVPCPRSPGDAPLAPHEKIYGLAGCDPIGAASASSLVVPSRQNACGTELPCPSSDLLGCYTERLKRSNDFSMLLDRLFALETAASSSGASSPVRRGKGSSIPIKPFQVVQEFVLSPDATMRYRDVATGQSAYDLAKGIRMWESSPFVQLPMEEQSQGVIQGHSQREAGDLLCRSIPRLPYIDLGGYGFVETACSCAVAGTGELVGVYCNDYTVPFRPPWVKGSVGSQPIGGSQPRTAQGGNAHESLIDYIPGLFRLGEPVLQKAFLEFRAREQNSLFEWNTVSISTSALPCGRESIKVLPPDSLTENSESAPASQAAEDVVSSEEVTAICGALNAKPDKFFQQVQTISYENGHHSLFFIPLSRAAIGPTDARIGILLRPNPAGPLLKSKILAIVTWFAFLLMFLVRARIQSMRAMSLRDDAILRGLPAGVIDVIPAGASPPSPHPASRSSQRIEFANDRAEEVLRAALPVFGSRNDPAEGRQLLELIDEDVFEIPDSGDTSACSLKHVTIEEIDYYRRLGKSTAYFARLTYGSEKGNEGDPPWIRLRGDAIFGDETFEDHKPRTFAVVQAVIEHETIDALENAWNAVKNMRRAAQKDFGGGFL